MEKYFESIEDAEKFVKKNGITKYEYHTPEYTYKGVDLSYEPNYKIEYYKVIDFLIYISNKYEFDKEDLDKFCNIIKGK